MPAPIPAPIRAPGFVIFIISTRQFKNQLYAQNSHHRQSGYCPRYLVLKSLSPKGLRTLF